MTDLTLRDVSDPHARKGPAGPTPGPWRVVRPMHGHATEYLCVQIGDDETYTTLEMLPADARLAAAAPDLAAACRAWVDYFDRLARDDEPGDPLAAARNSYHAKRVEATRAALAKAGPAAPADHKRLTDDEVAARWLSALRAGPKPGTNWRHRKSGKVYEAAALAMEEATLTPLVIYRRDGTPAWTRPLAEFLEKFEPAD